MSRWLKSVGSILEKLDDRVETVAEDASNILIDTDGVPTNMTGLASRFMRQSQTQTGEIDDGSYEYEDEYYDQDDDDQFGNSDAWEEQERGAEEVDESGDGTGLNNHNKATEKSEPTQTEASTSDAGDLDTGGGCVPEKSPQTSDAQEKPLIDNPAESKITAETATGDTAEASSTVPPASRKNPSVAAIRETQAYSSTPPSAERRIPPAPRSQTSTASASGKSAYSRSELQKSQQELQRLTKQNAALKAQLEAAEAELKAQNKELEQAAERMAEDRQLADEERDDMLDEHEEALRNLQASYEARIADQREKFDNQIAELRERLETEARMRAKEGGDMTEELGDAINRERQALQKANQLETEKSQIEHLNTKLRAQEEALREEVKRLSEAAQTAEERERQAEERLDAVNEAHQRALSCRQAREAELEQTVAELGAALANKESEQKSGVASAEIGSISGGNGNSIYQRKYDMAMEELEGTKSQLKLANQRCEALQNELQILSHERTDEASAAQEKEREHDQKVEQLSSKISRLEASLREYKAMSSDTVAVPPPPESGSSIIDNNGSNAKARQLTRDLDKARRQIASLSDQLLRQQALTESAKAEALALRGRLQSAVTRAEAAEQAAAETPSSGRMVDMGGGGIAYGAAGRRRRIKMGGGTQRGGRTMRSTLGLHPTENSALDQVAQTVDAIDLWMFEAGNILKHEPLARLALLVYMLLVHLWCFGLVFFHAVESEHGDLGTLTTHRNVLNVANQAPNLPP